MRKSDGRAQRRRRAEGLDVCPQAPVRSADPCAMLHRERWTQESLLSRCHSKLVPTLHHLFWAWFLIATKSLMFREGELKRVLTSTVTRRPWSKEMSSFHPSSCNFELLIV